MIDSRLRFAICAPAVLAILTGGCAEESAPTAVEAGGASVFDGQCSACHGPAGRGPSLDELRALSPDALRAGIRNHPTAGDLPERLTADKLDKLIEFLEE